MTTLAPLFCDPEYEQPEDGCELQARWPGLVGTARSSSVVSQLPVFYEWAPLPGGLFLVGVGHAETPPGPIDGSLRETILARMLAGHALEESVQRAFVETRVEGSEASACYALLDPAHARMDVVGRGPHASLILVTGGGSGVLRLTPAHELGARTFEFRDGEAVLFVAHPSLWERHLLDVVDRDLLESGEPWDERAALGLCGRISHLLPGDSASALLFRPPHAPPG